MHLVGSTEMNQEFTLGRTQIPPVTLRSALRMNLGTSLKM